MITAEDFVPGLQVKVTVKGLKPSEDKDLIVVIIATGPFDGVRYVIANAPGVLSKDGAELAEMLNAHGATILGHQS